MFIYIQNDVEYEFVQNFMVKYIQEYMIAKVKNNRKYERMNTYFIENFKEPLLEAVILLANNIQVTEGRDHYKIEINPNILDEKSNQYLRNIERLIDYGNTGVKGTFLIQESMLYIKSLYRELYTAYLIKGGR